MSNKNIKIAIVVTFLSGLFIGIFFGMKLEEKRYTTAEVKENKEFFDKLEKDRQKWSSIKFRRPERY